MPPCRGGNARVRQTRIKKECVNGTEAAHHSGCTSSGTAAATSRSSFSGQPARKFRDGRPFRTCQSALLAERPCRALPRRPSTATGARHGQQPPRERSLSGIATAAGAASPPAAFLPRHRPDRRFAIRSRRGPAGSAVPVRAAPVAPRDSRARPIQQFRPLRGGSSADSSALPLGGDRGRRAMGAEFLADRCGICCSRRLHRVPSSHGVLWSGETKITWHFG